MSSQTQQLAEAAGKCSYLQTWSNPFGTNYASVAGGALYTTDMASMDLKCVDGQGLNITTGCPAWFNNTVGVAWSQNDRVSEMPGSDVIMNDPQPFRVRCHARSLVRILTVLERCIVAAFIHRSFYT